MNHTLKESFCPLYIGFGFSHAYPLKGSKTPDNSFNITGNITFNSDSYFNVNSGIDIYIYNRSSVLMLNMIPSFGYTSKNFHIHAGFGGSIGISFGTEGGFGINLLGAIQSSYYIVKNFGLGIEFKTPLIPWDSQDYFILTSTVGVTLKL